MSEIAATSLTTSLTLGRQVAGDILALKLALQQDRAVLALVEKALEAPQRAVDPAPAANRLVDVVV